MAVQPEVTQTAQHSGALLDHLARRMRLRSEAVLAPLGPRPRHLVALTVLRDGGGSTQQALAATLEMDGTNIVGLLKPDEDQIQQTKGHSRSSCRPAAPGASLQHSR